MKITSDFIRFVCLCAILHILVTRVLLEASTGTYVGNGVTAHWSTSDNGDDGITLHFLTGSVATAQAGGHAVHVTSFPYEIGSSWPSPRFVHGAVSTYGGSSTDTSDFSGSNYDYDTQDDETVYVTVTTLDSDGAEVSVEATDSFTINFTASNYKVKTVFHNVSTMDIQVVGKHTVSGTPTTFETIDLAAGATVTTTYDALPDNSAVGFYAHFSGISPVGTSFLTISDMSHDVSLGSLTPALTSGSITPTLTKDVKGFMPTVADSDKTLWVGNSTTLDADLYREGVDMQVAAIRSMSSTGNTTIDISAITDSMVTMNATISASGNTTHTDLSNVVTAISNQTTSLAQNKGTSTDYQAPLVTANSTAATYAGNLSGQFGNVTHGTFTPAGSAGDGFKFGTMTVLGTTFNFAPFAYDADLALRSNLHWCREAFLWLAVLSFLYFCREKLEKYMLAYFGTSQAGTKPETTQILIPGVGWGKQAALAAIIIGAFLTAVAGTIAAMNSQLGGLLAGTSLLSAVGDFKDFVSTMQTVGTGPEKVWGIINEYFPTGAYCECIVAGMVFSWALPGIWAFSFMSAKALQP